MGVLQCVFLVGIIVFLLASELTKGSFVMKQHKIFQDQTIKPHWSLACSEIF